MSMEKTKRALNEKEAAPILGVSPKTLQHWRYKGIGPRYVRVGKAIRYMADDLDEYIESRTITPALGA